MGGGLAGTQLAGGDAISTAALHLPWLDAERVRPGAWQHRAAVAHAVYAPEVRHPVEVNVAQGSASEQRAQEEHLARWLGKRLDMPVKLYDLRPQGFELVGGRLLPLGTEAGHIGFAAESAEEDDILRWLRAREGRVCVESLLCAPGLARLHAARVAMAGGPEQAADAHAVVAAARAATRRTRWPSARCAEATPRARNPPAVLPPPQGGFRPSGRTQPSARTPQRSLRSPGASYWTSSTGRPLSRSAAGLDDGQHEHFEGVLGIT